MNEKSVLNRTKRENGAVKGGNAAVVAETVNIESLRYELDEHEKKLCINVDLVEKLTRVRAIVPASRHMDRALEAAKASLNVNAAIYADKWDELDAAIELV